MIYINDLATNVKLNVKLFADDTSLFSILSTMLETAKTLNKDLRKIGGERAKQLKLAQKVVFSKKCHEIFHPKHNRNLVSSI